MTLFLPSDIFSLILPQLDYYGRSTLMRTCKYHAHIVAHFLKDYVQTFPEGLVKLLKGYHNYPYDYNSPFFNYQSEIIQRIFDINHGKVKKLEAAKDSAKHDIVISDKNKPYELRKMKLDMIDAATNYRDVILI